MQPGSPLLLLRPHLYNGIVFQDLSHHEIGVDFTHNSLEIAHITENVLSVVCVGLTEGAIDEIVLSAVAVWTKRRRTKATGAAAEKWVESMATLAGVGA